MTAAWVFRVMGSSPLPEGKQVWFRLQVDDNWPNRTGCPCAGEALERVRLEWAGTPWRQPAAGTL